MWLLSFPNIVYQRDRAFPAVYSQLFCHKVINYLCMGLLLGYLFCSINPCICFYVNTLLICLKSESAMPPAVTFFLKIALASGAFYGSIQIWGIFFYFHKKNAF